MKREIADFVEDIINAMNKAAKFVEGMSYEELVQELKDKKGIQEGAG